MRSFVSRAINSEANALIDKWTREIHRRDWNDPLSANGNRQRALTSFYSIRWQPPTDTWGPDLRPWCDKKNVSRSERGLLRDRACVPIWHLHIAAHLYCHVKAVDLIRMTSYWISYIARCWKKINWILLQIIIFIFNNLTYKNPNLL